MSLSVAKHVRMLPDSDGSMKWLRSLCFSALSVLSLFLCPSFPFSLKSMKQSLPPLTARSQESDFVFLIVRASWTGCEEELCWGGYARHYYGCTDAERLNYFILYIKYQNITILYKEWVLEAFHIYCRKRPLKHRCTIFANSQNFPIFSFGC